MVLFLNDIGTGEVLLILVFILIFFGAKSIPGLARTMGRTMRQIKDASNDLQNEIRKSGNDMKKDLDLKGILQETSDDLKRPLDQYAQDIDDALKYRPTNSQPRVTQKDIEKATQKPMIDQAENVESVNIETAHAPMEKEEVKVEAAQPAIQKKETSSIDKADKA